MHLKERELRKKYRYTKLSYVFDIYCEFEYRVNSTEEEYEGLKTGEVRFDYATWERRLEYSHKQMIRAIKELVNEGYIIQTFKGKKGESSKYFLTRFEEQKKEQKENRNKASNNKGSEGFKEQKKEQKRIHTSRYSNQDIKSNIYSDIFNFWNEKEIIVHRSLTTKIEKAIDKALKEYTVEEIKQAIDNYNTVIKDNEYFFDYKWTLIEFLTRAKEGIKQISMFLEDGSQWINYQNSKNKNKVIPFNNKKDNKTGSTRAETRKNEVWGG